MIHNDKYLVIVQYRVHQKLGIILDFFEFAVYSRESAANSDEFT